MLNRPDAESGDLCSLFACVQMLSLVNLVVETVEHEVQQIRNHSFRTFTFQQFYQMIVAGRRELHEDLADYADTGLLDIQYRNRIEITNDLSTHLAELRNADMLGRYEFLYPGKPFFV